ncbi:MAG TPA: hypothetical protein ENG29_00690 [Firmicutes bacterium]|nr:hypothetical protein [Bacillota bacterium]
MREISFMIDGSEFTYDVRELPLEFVKWQCESRKALLQLMIDGEAIFTGFGAHLPVMTTKSESGDFPTNSAAKGVGLLPRPELLEELIERLRELEDEAPLRKERVPKRSVQFLIEFYSDMKKIDTTLLGSLEIYGKNTFRNVKKDPRVNLLYVDVHKGGLSYMVNTVVEIVDHDNPYYEFIRLVHDLFHRPLKKRQYSCAYLFHICEVYDKSPGKNAGNRLI